MNEDEFMSNVAYFWFEKGDISRFSEFSLDRLKEIDEKVYSLYLSYKQSENELSQALRRVRGEL